MTLPPYPAPILHTVFSSRNFQSICDVKQFLKYIPCLLAHTLSNNGHPIPFCEFSLPLLAWLLHLVDHHVHLVSSFTLCQPILYVVNKEADFSRVESSSCLIFIGLRYFEWKYYNDDKKTYLYIFFNCDNDNQFNNLNTWLNIYLRNFKHTFFNNFV